MVREGRVRIKESQHRKSTKVTMMLLLEVRTLQNGSISDEKLQWQDGLNRDERKKLIRESRDARIERQNIAEQKRINMQ